MSVSGDCRFYLCNRRGGSALRATLAQQHHPDDAPDPADSYWEPGPAQTAIDAVATAVDGLLEVDPTAPGTGATLDLLRAVEMQTRRLYGMSVSVISQMDHRGLAAPAGQLSTTSLVRQIINISRTDAAARVRRSAATSVGTGMSGAPIPARLPLLAAAVHAGTIGPRHADLVTGVFKTFDASVPQELRESVETFLVAEATVADPSTFDQVCRSIILAANPDGPQEEKDAHDKQEFHIGARRPDGLTKVWGLLDDLTVESLRVVFGAGDVRTRRRPQQMRRPRPRPRRRPRPGR
ncbi:hypothetical protein ABIB25_005233 [Nakamurella sp. UYEF19]|uniref:DUF222 domain-containing protein n=1 Tax=Nakamurella sp. UYEF19 TaxID=1756392 RepID=UPI00339A6D83